MGGGVGLWLAQAGDTKEGRCVGVGGVQVACVSEEVCVWLCAVWVSLFA